VLDSFRRQFLHPYFLLIYVFTALAVLSGWDFVAECARDQSAATCGRQVPLAASVLSTALSAVVGGLVVYYLASAFAFPWKGLTVTLLVALNVLVFAAAVGLIDQLGLTAASAGRPPWFTLVAACFSLTIHCAAVVFANCFALPDWHPRAGWWNEDGEEANDYDP
jgi:hypothetical protein